MTTSQRSIFRAASTITVLFLVGSVLGMWSEVLIGRAFGKAADPYFAAFSIPDMLFNVIAGGALGSSFLPVFASLLAQEKRAAAWRLASNVINLVFGVILVSALFAAYYAPWLVETFIVSGWKNQPELIAQTAMLMRIMLISTVLFSISGLLVAVHHAHQHFLFPALAPIAFNGGIILGTIFLAPTLGLPGVAWGVVLGSAGYLLLQLIPLRGYHPRYHFDFGIDSSDTRQVGWLMLPRMVGLAVWEINFWVNKNIGSMLPIGSITALDIGFKLANVPQIVLARALASAVFPTFARQAALKDQNGIRDTLRALLQSVIFLALPATAGLILLGKPLLILLFASKEFDARQITFTQWALIWYTAGLLSHSAVEIITRVYYSLQDTRSPLLISVGTMVSNVILSLALSRAFDAIGWLPLGGIAFANTLATTLEAILLLHWLRPHVGNLGLTLAWSTTWRTGLATGGMALAMGGWLAGVDVSPFWHLAGGFVIGFAVFVGLAILLRPPEVQQIWDIARRKIGK